MSALTFIILAALVIFAVWDLIYKEIPSILLTSAIIIPLYLMPSHLFLGALAALFGIAFIEIGHFQGMADLKAMVIVGLMLKDMSYFPFFLIFIVMVGLIYILIWRFLLDETEEIPFVPVFTIVYVILFMMEGVV